MIPREIESIITENLQYFAVTGIIGPRQVGKTTLAKTVLQKIKTPYLHLDLELESDLFKLQEAETFLQFHQEKLIVIDEVQRLPKLFTLIRALVDQRRTPGRFMLLGSASPSIIRKASETLAGRIVYTELFPLSLREVAGSIGQTQHWLRGGFPEALLMPHEHLVWRWMDSFLSTFLERDIRMLGYEIAPEAMRRTLQILTAYHGNLLNMSELSRSLGITTPTLTRYLDILEGSFLVRRLRPYHVNIGKRLVKSPKFYFRDSGVLHALTGVASFEKLIESKYLGASWEGYVIEQIRRCAPERWEFYFYRTQSGAEADLVIQRPDGQLFIAEIKFSLSASISRGFYQSAEDLHPTGKYLIVSSGDAFPRSDGTIVCSLAHFLEVELPALR